MAPLKLTNKDIDLITRLVATEADHKLAWSHPEEYSQQVHGIVDTVMNRVASGHWGDTVASVANAKNQFSAINGPTGRGYDVYGSVDKVPDSAIPAFLPNIVNSWVTARRTGTPSSVGGGLNYANPKFSDAANLEWINALDGPKLGFGNSTHFHGTVAGMKPIEAKLAPLGGTEGLMAIQDRKAEALGYGALPPTPATMSPALQAARARLAAAREQMKATTAAGMTPANNLQLSPKPGGGVITAAPSANANLNLARSEQAAQRVAAATPKPAAAEMPPLPRPRPATPVAQTPAVVAPVTPAAATPQMVKLASGKSAKVGDTAVLNGAVWTVTDTGNGTGKLVKADAGILGEVNKKTVAGGVVREKMGEAITAGKDAAVTASKPIIDNVAKTTGDLLGQAGNFLGGLFGGATLGAPDNGVGVKLSVPITQPKTASLIPGPAKPALMDSIGNGATLDDLAAFIGTPAIVPPIPATMSPGLRTAALPASNPIVVSRPKTASAAPAQPKLYQAGGYVYAANPSGSGYTKVGKVGQISSGSGSSSSSSSPSKVSSSSSSSSSVPQGYTDLGNGKIQSESGGIYYTRNL